MEPTPETLRPSLTSFTFSNTEEAAIVWNSLSPSDQEQMALTYQKAFAGDPWYEVGMCQSCGRFTSSMSMCQSCNSEEIAQAYPVEDLVEDYFPNGMLGAYLPGMLSLAKVEGQVVGFTTGGFVQLGSLIQKKYSCNRQILDSIKLVTGLAEQDTLFYDNETCVDNSYQGLGIGKLLSLERRELAVQLGANLICGRTVNLPWLAMKNRDLSQIGFEFMSFIPDGDDYEINGLLRNFYLAY